MPKSRSRARRPVHARRPAAPARSKIDLIRGVAGPNGVRIRLARRGELESVAPLLALAEPNLPDDGAIMLEHPLLATGLLHALRKGRPPTLSTTGFNPYEESMGVSMMLAAVDEHDTVLGVLMGLPPVRILGKFLQAGYPPRVVAGAVHTVAKLKGVAVAEAARGRGIGTALIDVCVRIYSELGWRAVYGQFDKKRPQLADYYTRLGFTVLRPHHGVEFGHLVGFPLAALPLGGERMFVRWLNAATG